MVARVLSDSGVIAAENKPIRIDVVTEGVSVYGSARLLPRTCVIARQHKPVCVDVADEKIHARERIIQGRPCGVGNAI